MKLPIPAKSGIRELDLKYIGTGAMVKAADHARAGRYGSAYRIIVAAAAPELAGEIQDVPWPTAEVIAVKAWNLDKPDPSTEYAMVCESPACGATTIFKKHEQNGVVIRDDRARLSELPCYGFNRQSLEECNQEFIPRIPVMIKGGEGNAVEIRSYTLRWPTIGDMCNIERDGKLAGFAAATARALLEMCVVEIDGVIHDPALVGEQDALQWVRECRPDGLLEFPDPEDFLALQYLMTGAGYRPIKTSYCETCGNEQVAEVPFANFFDWKKTRSVSPGAATNSGGPSPMTP